MFVVWGKYGGDDGDVREMGPTSTGVVGENNVAFLENFAPFAASLVVPHLIFHRRTHAAEVDVHVGRVGDQTALVDVRRIKKNDDRKCVWVRRVRVKIVRIVRVVDDVVDDSFIFILVFMFFSSFFMYFQNDIYIYIKYLRVEERAREVQ